MKKVISILAVAIVIIYPIVHFCFTYYVFSSDLPLLMKIALLR